LMESKKIYQAISGRIKNYFFNFLNSLHSVPILRII